MHDPAVDSVVVHIFTNMADRAMFSDMARLKNELGKPVVAWLAGMGDGMRSFRSELEELGIPAYDEMHRCVSVLAAIKEHNRKRGSVHCRE